MLQCGLAIPLSAQGSALPEVERLYSRALELAHQVGTPQEMGFVLLGLAQLYIKQGAFGTARAFGEQLLSVSQRLQDPTLLLWSHATLGSIHMRLGEFTAARDHLEYGLVYYEPRQRRLQIMRYGIDPGLVCLGALTWTLWYLGYPDQALQWSQEALRLAQIWAHPYSLGITLTYAAALHGLRQEWRLVQERAETIRQLAIAHGFAKLLASATRYQGMALFWQGQSAGITHIKQGMVALQAMRTQEAHASQLASLAEMYAHVGHVEEGTRLVHEAIAIAHATEEQYAEANRYCTMGELLLRHSPPDFQQAEGCFQRALEIAQCQHAKAWELRAAMSLSRLWQQQGKRSAAHQLLAAVYARFTEGFATVDLQQAQVLLEQLV
jgi:predicted ATPase